MRIAETNSGAPESAAQTPARLSVVVVYEDLATGLRAKRALESLHENREVEADFAFEMWRLDLLRAPEVGLQVREQSKSADMVVLSAHGRDDLPGEALPWLDKWLQERGKGPAALVISLDEATGEDRPVSRRLATLESVARAAGVDMFRHFASGGVSGGGASAPKELGQGSGASTELLQDPLSRLDAYEHWGLNE